MKRNSSSLFDEELFHAVEKGSLHNVQVLVDQGADIHAQKSLHGTVMHVAARYGHEHLLSFFLSKGLNVNVTDTKRRNTPLHVASRVGRAEVVQFLLDQNANMHAVNSFGQIPGHVAIEAGQKEVTEIFLKNGMYMGVDKSGSTLLHMSCFSGKLNIVELLVHSKADIHVRNGDGRKPIHVAAVYGHTNIVQFFLNRGMSVDDSDKKGRTLLHWACQFCDLKIVKFLVANNANIHATASDDGHKPIHVAATWGQEDVVEYFLNLGMNVGEMDKHGHTVLHFAAKGNSGLVVRFLVDRIGEKSQLDAQDNKGKTPMHMCNFDGVGLLNCLLDAGARSDIKDHDGRTVLFYYLKDFMRRGAFYYSLSLLEKLHHNCIDIDDKTNMTAAHIVARDFHNSGLTMFVLQHQKDLNIADKFGRTAMNYLSRSSYMSEWMIRSFVDNGACFTAEDCERIIQNRSMKERLFTDKKFCSQCIVNKFDNDLQRLGRLPSAIPPSVQNRLKLKSSQIRLIELAVEEEIRNKGHCDLSKMVPPLLSLLAIESYISHVVTCLPEFYSNLLN